MVSLPITSIDSLSLDAFLPPPEMQKMSRTFLVVLRLSSRIHSVRSKVSIVQVDPATLTDRHYLQLSD